MLQMVRALSVLSVLQAGGVLGSTLTKEVPAIFFYLTPFPKIYTQVSGLITGSRRRTS